MSVLVSMQPTPPVKHAACQAATCKAKKCSSVSVSRACMQQAVSLAAVPYCRRCTTDSYMCDICSSGKQPLP